MTPTIGVRRTTRLMLRNVRFGAITFELGGVRDLDPDTRVTPGSHPRQTR